MAIILFIYLLSLGCWLGSMVFFGFFVPQAIFGQVPPSEAGKILSVIFPRYYMEGYVAGSTAVVIAICFAALRAPRLWWTISAAALCIALGLSLYGGLNVLPKADGLRTAIEQPNPDPAQQAEFDRLHRLSVTLNGGTMVLNLIALFATAKALVAYV